MNKVSDDMKRFGQHTRRPERVTLHIGSVVAFCSWLFGGDACGVGKDVTEGGGLVDVRSGSI